MLAGFGREWGAGGQGRRQGVGGQGGAGGRGRGQGAGVVGAGVGKGKNELVKLVADKQAKPQRNHFHST